MGTHYQSGSLPCAACGTRGGHVPEGDKQPRRRRQLCDACYRWHTGCGTLERFPVAITYVNRRGQRTRIPAERRVEQQEAIARRVALHEAIGAVTVLPVVEGEVDAATVAGNAERAARAWLTLHPRQWAGWDRPDLQAYLIGGGRAAA